MLSSSSSLPLARNDHPWPLPGSSSLSGFGRNDLPLVQRFFTSELLFFFFFYILEDEISVNWG